MFRIGIERALVPLSPYGARFMKVAGLREHGIAAFPLLFPRFRENSNDGTLLVIDSDPHTVELIRTELNQSALEIISALDSETGMDLFTGRLPQVVLLDLKSPQSSGMGLLERMLGIAPSTDVILMAADDCSQSAVNAIQKGACDYLNKPLDLPRLHARVEALLNDAMQRRRAVELDHESIETFQFEGILGRSPLMLDVFAKIRRVGPHFETALITGPTGTGKELVARALHRRSSAPSGPFAVCNCSAITETLFESEVFGYVKGAFTGAVQDKIGLFEYANGGTVFLDEIGDMPLPAQAKLLRVLQSHEIQRVGSPMVRNVDVRVIAATNSDLRALAGEKKFRDDLYYRLSMVEIVLPPLADRKEDLPLLRRYLIEKFNAQFNKKIKGLTRKAQAVVSRYSWPGNVRQLENVLGNAVMMAEGDVIDLCDLPKSVYEDAPDTRAGGTTEMLSLREVERRHVLRVLEHEGGNKVRAAKTLGVSRATLYKLLTDADTVRRETPISKVG